MTELYACTILIKKKLFLFYNLIITEILEGNKKVDLSKVDFIEPRNCNLILGLYKEDEGIITVDNQTFFCMLTRKAYEEMLVLLKPFTEKDTKAHQYLYDIDTPIEFLFAPAGIW